MPNNEFDQEIGDPVNEWAVPLIPALREHQGQYCRLEPLSADKHAGELYEEFTGNDALWTYMAYGPFTEQNDYVKWVESVQSQQDPAFFAIINQETGRALGQAAFLRITPNAGAIEVGHICYGPSLQQTPAATEAMYLMMKHAFELGYRRYEWKCDALNQASRRAAARLGFVYEGCFRQALVYKKRNRDTAWFSIIDKDWPKIQNAFEEWLDPSNFNEQGKQRQSLSALTQAS